MFADKETRALIEKQLHEIKVAKITTTEGFLNRKGGVEGVDFKIDDKYWCESCGSHTHREDMHAMCYECGADDWAPEYDKINEIFKI